MIELTVNYLLLGTVLGLILDAWQEVREGDAILKASARRLDMTWEELIAIDAAELQDAYTASGHAPPRPDIVIFR